MSPVAHMLKFSLDTIIKVIWRNFMSAASFVCAILSSNDGTLLLQKRIVEGKEAITVFGGYLRENEDFIPGLARELSEELGYEFDREDAVEVGDFQRTDKKSTLCKLFLIKNANIRDISVQEGEPVLMKIDAASADDRLTDTTREMVLSLRPLI